MKYNLGCQKDSEGSREGWINVDIENSDLNFDLSNKTWPIENNSATELLCSHVLEHFTREKGKIFLRNCYSILKPGGFINIAVPDMNKFIDCKLTEDWSSVDNYYWKDLNWFMGGNEEEPNLYMRHYHMYNEESLSWTLQSIGFKSIKRDQFNDLYNKCHEPISLYMKAQK